MVKLGKLVVGFITATVLATGACVPVPAGPPPGLVITAPADGATVVGNSIRVSVQVSNFSLVSKLGQANVPGEGHIHYFLDVEAPTAPGQPAVTGAGTYAATAETSHTWSNVSPGTHTLSAELINNDHTPLATPVVAKVTVMVLTSPTLSIASPQNGATIAGPTVTIVAQTTNEKLVDKLGQANVPDEGHLHYFMDVDAPTTPGQPAVTAPGTYAAAVATSHTWGNVAAGTHTFSVELVNNDHTPMVPPVVAKVTVTVTVISGSGGGGGGGGY